MLQQFHHAPLGLQSINSRTSFAKPRQSEFLHSFALKGYGFWILSSSIVQDLVYNQPTIRTLNYDDSQSQDRQLRELNQHLRLQGKQTCTQTYLEHQFWRSQQQHGPGWRKCYSQTTEPGFAGVGGRREGRKKEKRSHLTKI